VGGEGADITCDFELLKGNLRIGNATRRVRSMFSTLKSNGTIECLAKPDRRSWA